MSDDPKCVAGCVKFYGGEKRHHKDCPYYPESLTKANADRIEELEAAIAAVGSASAYRITALEAENAKLRANMHEAMNAVAEAARARGEAEGKLEASEMAGVLEGWIEKCAALEAKLAKAVRLAEQECPFGYGTGSYNDWWHERRKTLAELKGDSRE